MKHSIAAITTAAACVCAPSIAHAYICGTGTCGSSCGSQCDKAALDCTSDGMTYDYHETPDPNVLSRNGDGCDCEVSCEPYHPACDYVYKGCDDSTGIAQFCDPCLPDYVGCYYVSNYCGIVTYGGGGGGSQSCSSAEDEWECENLGCYWECGYCS